MTVNDRIKPGLYMCVYILKNMFCYMKMKAEGRNWGKNTNRGE